MNTDHKKLGDKSAKRDRGAVVSEQLLGLCTLLSLS